MEVWVWVYSSLWRDTINESLGFLRTWWSRLNCVVASVQIESELISCRGLEKFILYVKDFKECRESVDRMSSECRERKGQNSWRLQRMW